MMINDIPKEKPREFEPLLRDSQQQVAGIDELFSAKEGNVSRAVYLDRIDGVYFEIMETRVLLFSARQSEEAAWESLRNFSRF